MIDRADTNNPKFDYNVSNDAIGVFENVYYDGFCEKVIEIFHTLKGHRLTHTRQEGERAPASMKKDNAVEINQCINRMSNDTSIDLRPANMFVDGNGDLIGNVLMNGLQECWQIYSNYFPTLVQGASDPFQGYNVHYMKMQETEPQGGYHVWHHEHGPGEHSTRAAVFMIYLNTLDPSACGETEFLHQEKRFNPVSNKLIIWPAGYTHAHRGNPVYGNKSKYIVTGWFSV